MSRKPAPPRRASRKSNADGLQNIQARLGSGAGVDNLAASTTYELNPITRNRVQLDYMYRGSWIVRTAVDAPADDMTRAGVEFLNGIEPKDADRVDSEFMHMGLWAEIAHGLRWAGLYGGAIVVMLVDGQDYAEPLRPETIRQNQFRGLMALDRWQLQPTLTDLINELGPEYGKPRFYQVVADSSIAAGYASPLYGKKIHHTRVMRFDGIPLPFYQRIAESGWGMSRVEPLYDRLIAFDSATQGAGQLVYKAHLRTMKIEGLTKILGSGGPAAQVLTKQIENIRRFQSSEGLTVIDAKDSIEHFNNTFSGMSDIILQFGQQLAGALQIPLVRLFGQSPAGLNSSGESDLRTYYDAIAKDQERILRAPLARLLDVIHMSALGRPMEATWAFSSLWQMSAEQKSKVAADTTTAVIGAFDAGLINKPTAMKELRQLSDVTGVFSNIENDAIEAAAEEPPPAPETDLPEPPAPVGIEAKKGEPNERSTADDA